jgi:hypothetical protein
VAGHEGGAAGGADGGGDVELLKPGALAGKAVEVGGFDVGMAGEGGIAKALVVGEDEDDIRRALGTAGRGGGEEGEWDEEQDQPGAEDELGGEEEGQMEGDEGEDEGEMEGDEGEDEDEDEMEGDGDEREGDEGRHGRGNVVGDAALLRKCAVGNGGAGDFCLVSLPFKR